jgi:hypothetical protein
MTAACVGTPPEMQPPDYQLSTEGEAIWCAYEEAFVQHIETTLESTSVPLRREAAQRYLEAARAMRAYLVALERADRRSA